MTDPSALKRSILKALYEFHKGAGHASMKAGELVEAVRPGSEPEFFEALQHLHDEDYIEGEFLPYERQGYIEGARLSPRGAALMDNPAELDRVFPVGRGRERADTFFESLRMEIEAAEISGEEKEVLLVRFKELFSHPAVPGILSKALDRSRKP
jgi:hypothetical protein